MADPDERRTVRVRVEGRVQGVWFRSWTAEIAEALGLEGWVRNRADGTVEALFSGPGGAVERMIEACHQGPPLAVVSRVAVSPAEPEPGAGFRQLSTV